MKRLVLLTAAVAMLVFGCAQYSTSPDYMASQEYQSRENIDESLFKQDQAVLSNEDIERILSAKITLPAKSRIAILRFGQRYQGIPLSEEFAEYNRKIQQDFMAKLSSCERLRDVSLLPSLLTPKEMSVPFLREAAARFQVHFGCDQMLGKAVMDLIGNQSPLLVARFQ